MIRKVDLAPASHAVFGNPAPLGLLGLAISCAAITPIAFGYGVGPTGISASAFVTAAGFAFFFGVLCQLLTGLMEFANKNAYGGTIFTAFAFNWLITAAAFAAVPFGYAADHVIILATEILLLIVFGVLTYGFGFFSSTLFYFLLDIDLLYVCKIIRGFTGTTALNLPIAIFTVILGLIGLWLALAGLVNPITGRPMFKVGAPMFAAPRAQGFDFRTRRAIFDILYQQWQTNAFQELSMEELSKLMKESTGIENIAPDLFYLMEYGSLQVTFEPKATDKIASVRLTAAGIDLYEQLVMRKYQFAM